MLQFTFLTFTFVARNSLFERCTNDECTSIIFLIIKLHLYRISDQFDEEKYNMISGYKFEIFVVNLICIKTNFMILILYK